MANDSRGGPSATSMLRDALQCLIESDIYVRVLLNREDAVSSESLLELHRHLQTGLSELNEALGATGVLEQDGAERGDRPSLW